MAFRIWAPKASEVKLQCEGPEATPGFTQEQWDAKNRGYELQKGENGVWEIVIGPIQPGIYRYNFVVDGVRTNDPLNPRISLGLVQIHNLYEVPGATFSEYSPEIPHGAISIVHYFSKVTNTMRRMHVYTPPGYESGATKLAVLYLLHGATDSDDAWPTVGRAGAILDHLIAAQKATPMIVVMPAGHTTTEFRMGPGGRIGRDNFNDDLVSVIMPFVDGHYRTLADRDHRAIAGLSMGGAQTLAISLNHAADFGWVGVFSSGFFPSMMQDAEKTDLASYRASRQQFHLFWLGVGKSDFLLQTSHATEALLNRYGIKTEMHETEGFHSWNVWRDYLNMFAPLLFK